MAETILGYDGVKEDDIVIISLEKYKKGGNDK